MTGPANFKVRPWRSKRFLDFVRRLPCVVCRAPGPNDPHHHQGDGEGVMGGKVGDEYALPLCRGHHLLLHHCGRGKWQQWGIDPEQVITATQERWYEKHKTRPWMG